MRAITGRDSAGFFTIEDTDGELVDADSTPTVVVTDWEGSTVSGVTIAATDDTGVYKVTIPPIATADRLTVTMTATVGAVERTYTGIVPVTEGRTADLGVLRADSELSGLSGYNLMDVSDIVEDTLEDVLHFPPTPLVDQDIFLFRGGRRLHVPGMNNIVSVLYLDIDGEEYDVADLEVTDGAIYLREGSNVTFLTGGGPSFPEGRVTVWAVHGPPDSWRRGVPGDIRRVAVILARYTARTNNYPERARMIQTDGAMLTFSVASIDRPTGLPEVDGVLSRYRVQEAIA
jgi:hypothetical protein